MNNMEKKIIIKMKKAVLLCVFSTKGKREKEEEKNQIKYCKC
jgi:hypothetical protein